MFKMHNGTAPEYLTDLLPKNVGSKTSYNLRNSENIITPYSILKHWKDSFSLQQLTFGKNLHASVQNAQNISVFKASITSKCNKAPNE